MKFVISCLFIFSLEAFHFNEAVRRVERYNASLFHAERESLQRWEELQDVTSLPNPIFSVNVQGFGSANCSDDNEICYTLSQLVELGGKRKKRENLALHDIQRAQIIQEIKKIEILNRLKKNYYHTALIQKKRDIIQERCHIDAERMKAFEIEKEQGHLSLFAFKKHVSACKKRELQLKMAENALKKSKRELSLLWGELDCEDIAFELPECLTAQKTDLSQSPYLLLAFWDTSRARSEYDLARSNQIPDVTVTGGYCETFNHKNYLVFGIDIPLPIFNRNAGRVRAASWGVQKADRRYQAVYAAIQKNALEKEEALDAVKEEAEALQEMVKLAGEAFDAEKECYNTGNGCIEDFYGSLEMKLEALDTYLDSLGAYYNTLADVEYFTCEDWSEN